MSYRMDRFAMVLREGDPFHDNHDEEEGSLLASFIDSLGIQDTNYQLIAQQTARIAHDYGIELENRNANQTHTTLLGIRAAYSGSAVLARVVTGVGGLILSQAKNAARFLGRFAWNIGRFVVMNVIRPIIVGALGFALANPLAAAAIAAVGGAGYLVYRFVKGDSKEPELPADYDPDNLNQGYVEPSWIESMFGGSSSKSSTASSPSGTTTKPSQTYKTGQAAERMSAPPMSAAGNLKYGEKVLQGLNKPTEDVIVEASRRVGVDTGVMVGISYKESSFGKFNSTSSSSAQGIFQFITSTWDHVLSKYGDMYGVPRNASRFDPLYNAIMAAAYLKHDILPEIKKVVANPTITDLYLGHFMGPAGGKSWLKNYQANPNGLAYLDFPKESASNGPVYFEDFKNSGRSKPRTYAQIYAMFSGTLESVSQAYRQKTGSSVEATSNPSMGKSIVSDAQQQQQQQQQVNADGGPDATNQTRPSQQYRPVVVNGVLTKASL